MLVCMEDYVRGMENVSFWVHWKYWVSNSYSVNQSWTRPGCVSFELVEMFEPADEKPSCGKRPRIGACKQCALWLTSSHQ